MTETTTKPPKGKTTVYASLQSLYVRACRVNWAAGKTGSVGSIKMISVEKANSSKGEYADVTVRFADGSTGVVRKVTREEAEKWAKRTGGRVGARVFLPAK